MRAASSWTRVEAAVWRQLCAGQPFDFNGEAENLDPHQPEGWDESRVLSLAFVERLLEEPYAGVIDRHGIRPAARGSPTASISAKPPSASRCAASSAASQGYEGTRRSSTGRSTCAAPPSKAASGWSAPISARI